MNTPVRVWLIDTTMLMKYNGTIHERAFVYLIELMNGKETSNI